METTTTVTTTPTTEAQTFAKDALVRFEHDGQTYTGRVVKQDHWMYKNREMTKVCFGIGTIAGVPKWLAIEGMWVRTEDLVSLDLQEGDRCQTTDANGNVTSYEIASMDETTAVLFRLGADGKPIYKPIQAVKIGERKDSRQFKLKTTGLKLIPISETVEAEQPETVEAEQPETVEAAPAAEPEVQAETVETEQPETVETEQPETVETVEAAPAAKPEPKNAKVKAK